MTSETSDSETGDKSADVFVKGVPSVRAMITKGAIVALILTVSTAYIAAVHEEKGSFGAIWWFNEGDARLLQVLKLIAALASTILLYPFVHQGVSMTFTLVFLIIPNAAGVAIEQTSGIMLIGGWEVGFGERLFYLIAIPAALLFGILGTLMLVWTLVFGLVALVLMPCIIYSKIYGSGTESGAEWEDASNVTYFSIVQSISACIEMLYLVTLLPLSWIVIMASESPSDVLVNFVALQYFTQVDDAVLFIMFQANAAMTKDLSNIITRTNVLVDRNGKRLSDTDDTAVVAAVGEEAV